MRMMSFRHQSQRERRTRGRRRASGNPAEQERERRSGPDLWPAPPYRRTTCLTSRATTANSPLPPVSITGRVPAMKGLRAKLPPPNSILAFEAAARHQSFTRAARELHVTQAAVSRQIKTLEDHLGLAVFRRVRRTVQLTSEGKRLHEAVMA